MSDRDFEDWLKQQVPREPSAAVDARVLAALRAPRRADARRSYWRSIAAAAVIIAGLAFIGISGDRGVATPTRNSVAGERIEIPAHGHFDVKPNTTFRHRPRAPHLALVSGEIAATATSAALAIDVPGGTFRLARGSGAARIFEQREETLPNMKMQQQRSKRRTLVLVLSLAVVSAGWLELERGNVSLEGGDDRTFLILDADTAKPQVVAVANNSQFADAPRDSIPHEDIASREAAVTDAPSKTDAELAALFCGRIVDADTREPIDGASVAWVAHWDPVGIRSYTLRSRRALASISAASLVFEYDGGTIELGGYVEYHEAASTRFSATTLSDATGAFVLPARASSTEFLRVKADGYALARFSAPVAVAESAAAHPLEFALKPTCVVRGVIVDALGGPLIGSGHFTSVEVTSQLAIDDWTATWELRVSDDNSFSFELGEPTEVRLKVLAMGYEDSVEVVQARPGATNIVVQLTAQPHVFGHVYDLAGEPLADVRFAVVSTTRKLFGSDKTTVNGTTDADGYYLANTYGGDVSIVMQKDGYVQETRSLPPENTAVDFVLEVAEHCTVSGRVLDAVAQPLADVEVRLISDGPGVIRAYRDRTTADGAFEITDLPPGSYELVADPDSPPADADTAEVQIGIRLSQGTTAVPVRLRAIELKSGETRSDVEVRFPPAGRIVGSCRDVHGAPLANVWMGLYRPALMGGEHELLASVGTSGEGDFEFTGVPAGMVAVATPDGKYQLVDISAGETLTVHFGGAAAEVTGIVQREGRALAGAAIGIGRLSEKSIDTQLGTTDGDGKFRFENAAWGRYLLHVRDPITGFAMLTRFDVDQPTVAVRVDWPTTRVICEVVGDPLPPASRLRLDMVGLDALEFEGLIPASFLAIAEAVSSDGRTFEFTGIAPGRYRARVDGATLSAIITVETTETRATLRNR